MADDDEALIEKVAQAIKDAHILRWNGDKRSVGYYVSVGMDVFKHENVVDDLMKGAARAAIEAICHGR